MAVTHGIDVSDDQGTIDWDALKGHVDFAYVQIGYGTAHGAGATKTGSKNLNAAIGADLRAGAYYFAYPTMGSAYDQGAHARALLGSCEGDMDLPVALDLETNPESMSAPDLGKWVNDWLDATGQGRRHLAVYSNPGFWQANMAGAGPINAHSWVASYGAKSAPRLDGLPGPFCWQTSDRGHVPGIGPAVDLDTMMFVPDVDSWLPGMGGGPMAKLVAVHPGDTMAELARSVLPAGSGPVAVNNATYYLWGYNHLPYGARLEAGQTVVVPPGIL